MWPATSSSSGGSTSAISSTGRLGRAARRPRAEGPDCGPGCPIDLDRLTRQRRRHRRHESVLQRAVTEAVRRVGIARRASCHTVRHAVAPHVPEDGHDLRTVQEPLGHRDVSPTMIYPHVLNRGPAAGRSPADLMVTP